MGSGLFYMEKSEIIIQNDGVLIERTIRERELCAEQTVLDALTEPVTRVIRNVFVIADWGTVHANVAANDTLWSLAIDRIPLNARFRLINDVLVPVFASPTDLEMPLVWKAPKDLKLIFAISTTFEEEEVSVSGNWLFACRDKWMYRLPLPNLHDECSICMGSFESGGATVTECILASIEQFSKSKWNADLMRTTEQSQKFFRFKPTNETFQILPVAAEDWTALCEKVSTTITERIVL